jgi:hypothetical protein
VCRWIFASVFPIAACTLKAGYRPDRLLDRRLTGRKLVRGHGVPCSHDAKEEYDPALPEVHRLRAGFFENDEEPADLQAVPEKTLAKCQWHPK